MTKLSSIINVADHVDICATDEPYRPGIIFPADHNRYGRYTYEIYTFRQLKDEIKAVGRGLVKSGIKPGFRAVIMVKPGPELFILTFACLKTGIVPVMVDPGMGLKKLKKCLDEAEPQAFIGIPAAHLARIALGWSRKTLQKKVMVGKIPVLAGRTYRSVRNSGKHSNRIPVHHPEPNDTAAILFTSGSTGVPKGAIYTHRIFCSQVNAIRDTYGIEAGEIDLCTFPLFALFAPALGMTAIIPDMDATRPAKVPPRNIIRSVDDFGVTNMFGSPALLTTMGRYCARHNVQFPTIRRVISAGAPVHPSIMKLFGQSLPDTTPIYSGYGATEAMPVATIDSHTVLNETMEATSQGKGVCVGQALSHVDVKIIPVTDDPVEKWTKELSLTAGEIGEITVAGDVVTQAYYNRDKSTRLAKIEDENTGRKRHRMGDIGYLDNRDRLWFCGRKSHRVETTKNRFFTVSCEGVFNAHDAIFRTALVGVRLNDAIRPVVCVELKKRVSLKKNKICRELRAMAKNFSHTRDIDTFLFHPHFPVDIRHNSKIFREELTQWATKKLK